MGLTCDQAFYEKGVSYVSSGASYYFKVAPHRFMTVCVLVVQVSVICARSHHNIGFS